MTKHVLITGASGRLAGKLRPHISALGWNSVLLDRRRDVADREVVTADMSVYDESWVKYFGHAETVIHFAADPSQHAGWDSVYPNNIAATQNVLRAARAKKVGRVVFASSNFVMAGYRFESSVKLTTALPPKPMNPYGISKLIGEELGAVADIPSFIALRIGNCPPDNRPENLREIGVWFQQMWLSDRDLCNGVERAVLAKNVDYAVLNLMSDNPGMRWSLDRTRELIGYAPQDGVGAVLTEAVRRKDEEDQRNYAHWHKLSSLCANV